MQQRPEKVMPPEIYGFYGIIDPKKRSSLPSAYQGTLGQLEFVIARTDLRIRRVFRGNYRICDDVLTLQLTNGPNWNETTTVYVVGNGAINALLRQYSTRTDEYISADHLLWKKINVLYSQSGSKVGVAKLG